MQSEERTTNLAQQGGYNFITTIFIRAKSVYDYYKESNAAQWIDYIRYEHVKNTSFRYKTEQLKQRMNGLSKEYIYTFSL